jgi:hypothetical protein
MREPVKNAIKFYYGNLRTPLDDHFHSIFDRCGEINDDE